MIKKIVFCTLRPNKGATGGPGGVLYLQKSILGDSINEIPCEYRFNKVTIKPWILNEWINKIIFFLILIFERNTYYFTHDIETGDLLARLGKSYSMIFHHQGPVLREQTNLGYKRPKWRKIIMAKHERNAFLHANTLHFPSNGAAEMYFGDDMANCKRNEVNVKPALYNIIPQVTPCENEELNIKRDNNVITLFSLGTLTEAKGQDLTIDFICRHVNDFGKPIRFILVGKGPLKNELIQKLEELKKIIPSFSYSYIEAVSHDAVMYLHSISDIYIMLHRISIFDFATLEAMSQSSAIILSKVGGNVDLNMKDNIIFAEDVDNKSCDISIVNWNDMQRLNKQVFDEKFSKEAFVKQYEQFFTQIFHQ